MSSRPFVLIVDDQDQEAFALQLSRYGVDALHVLPGELIRDELAQASLVLIDEFIENWPEREHVRDEVGLFVQDGLALSGVLRSALEGRGPTPEKAPRPVKTALALRTGHLEVLAGGTPAFLRPMAVASRHDLEWAAEKSVTSAAALASLAHAAATLPDDWTDPTSPNGQLAWLNLTTQPWRDDAIAQIEECRPPWSVLAATSAGRRWLAWFLQRILPFPTFLVDDLRAASYLGLHPSALGVLAEGQSQIADLLRGAEYTGQLSSFSGRRWWRAGIAAVKDLALQTAEGRMADDIARAVADLHGGHLEALNLRYPVFAIDADYHVIEEPLELSAAVRLQPDDWPVYADDPWHATSSIGDDPTLDALIVIDDRSGDSDDDSQ